MNDLEATPDSTGAPPPAAAHDPYAVLRNRDVVLYLVGRLFASFGQQMLTVAVGWELYERTHSALALGLVGLTQMLPMVLFTLPAGHVADNHDRQRIIVLMNSGDRVREPGPDADLGAGRPCVLDLFLPVRWRAQRARSSGRPARRFCRTWSRAGTFPGR